MEDEHAALHMTDVFVVNTSCWCPQAFAFGSENAAVVPFKVDIATIEGLGNLDLEGLPLEKAQEGNDRHCPLAVLHRAEIVPEEKAFLLQDVTKGERRSKGWLVKLAQIQRVCRRVRPRWISQSWSAQQS